jgi:MSHA biogenesis protein MshJ
VKALNALFARINRASLRERTLLFVAALGLLSLVWNHFLLAPLTSRRTAAALALDEVHQRLALKSVGEGPSGLVEQYGVLKAREAALAAAIASADVELRSAELGMIAPQQMMTILAEVLSRQRDLTLVLLRDLPVELLLPPLPAGPPGSTPALEAGPYVHPVELVVRGGYLNVLSYLEDIESRPWSFQWRRFEFSTTADGPQYRIEFTTLSMQSNWLGV